ncbi:uncharacterized protein BDV17DRAFT_230518 [Aspergillus undulatus]|uniref:uncharacterized protein n=1 Tax=Aspergillus undulatus TaxID=1810928 RepID=UPI003CCD94C3
MSSTFSPSRQPPPPQPSHSLDGMEQVVPPSPPIPFAHTISRLHLDKPLPDIPGSSPTPYMTGSTAWSDDSSTVNSFEDQDNYHCHSSVSTESCPVFVRPGSADLADFADHPSVSTLDRAPSDGVDVAVVVDPYQHQKPGRIPDASYSSLALSTFLAENRYAPSPSPPPQWTPNPNPTNRSGPNHYFREKKFDFFPELAVPSALPANSPHTQLAPRPRKKDSGRSRWIPIPINIHSDKGTALANDVRNSLRNIQRRLSRNSLDKDKDKPKQRPITAPSPTEFTYTRVSQTYTYLPSPQHHTTPSLDEYDYYDHYNREHNYHHDRETSSPTSPLDPLYVSLGDKEPLAHVSDPISLSVSPTPTGSSISDESLNGDIDGDIDRYRYSRQSQLSIATPRTKQKRKNLAVPITPYQRYGAVIWDKSGKERKRLSYTGGKPRGVRFPRYRRKRDSTVKGVGGPASPSDLIPSSSTFRGSGRTQAQPLPQIQIKSQSQPRTPLQQGTRHAVKALQDGTNHVLFAIDGARKKMVRSGGSSGEISGAATSTETGVWAGKDDLRRTQLKSQIRLIGPVNPYTSHRADPWI